MKKFFQKRTYKFLLINSLRQKGSDNKLALSVAIGTFIGFIIPLFQMPIAAAIALTFRLNTFLTVIPVWITNPVTIVPFYYAILTIGSKVLNISFIEIWDKVTSNTEYNLVEQMWQLVKTLPLAFVIGASILGGIFAIINYLLALYFFPRLRQKLLNRQRNKTA